MNCKIKIELALSLIPGKHDNLDILYRKEVFWITEAQLAFWLFIEKDLTLTYKENNFPSLNCYNKFYYKAALGFFLTYDLHFKQTDLSFFENSSFLN